MNGNRSGSHRPTIRLDPGNVQRVTIRILLIVSVWLVAVWVVGAARHFLFLILLAWLAAIASEPAISWLVRRGWRRGRATALVGSAVLLVSAGLLFLFGRLLYDQVTQLVQSAPAQLQSIADQLNTTFGLQLDPSEITSSLQIDPGQIRDVADNLALGLLGWFGSLLSVVIDLATVIVFTFFIAAAGPKLIQLVATWLPPDRQLVFGEVWSTAQEKTGGYVASKVVLAALSAVFHGVFFWAIGLPGWLPLALLAGIVGQFVPVIGVYIGVAVPMLVALADRPITALWILLFSVVYQQIETYVFTPRVSQRTMEVHPAIALAAVFVGAAIWGPIGAVIGVPIAAVAVSLVQTYGRRYELAAPLAAQSDPVTATERDTEKDTARDTASERKSEDEGDPESDGNK